MKGNEAISSSQNLFSKWESRLKKEEYAKAYILR
jgi:hypothetical protein